MRVSSSLSSSVFFATTLCLVQGAPVTLHHRQLTTVSSNPLLQKFYSSVSDFSNSIGLTSNTTAAHDFHPIISKTSKTATTTTTTSNDDGTSVDQSVCPPKYSSIPTTTTTASSSTPTTDPISTPSDGPPTSHVPGSIPNTTSSCFPALNFSMPDTVPDSLDGWWCSMEDEYAFLGFSYEVSACQSQAQLTKDFTDARNTFDSRYIRLYGACDDAGFYDKVIEAAWTAGLGVQALIWFGFDGDDSWKGRKTELFKSLKTNPKAPFVTRALQFGSEPLFDYAIDPSTLASEVKKAQASLADLEIPVTVSEMAWGYASRMGDGSQAVIDAIDFVDAHMLPYFAPNASTGGKAWYNDMYDMNQLLEFTNSEKKIIWSQNGWPSTHYCPGVCPNSPTAVSSVKSEKAYYNLLDSKCTDLKQFPKGGVGWFAHLYSDNQEPGYGIYDTNGNTKFDFHPQTSC